MCEEGFTTIEQPDVVSATIINVDMVRLAWLFAAILFAPLLLAQDPQCADVRRSANEITFITESWRPLHPIARAVASRFDMIITVEDPVWAFPLDTEDVAAADPQFSASHNNVHYTVMKRHRLQISLPVEGKPPVPASEIMRRVAEAANAEMPYGYRVDAGKVGYALVPTKTHTNPGSIDVTPLLDRRVTIPRDARTIAEHAKLLAQELRRQTGVRVACCQSLVAGVPWGTARVEFGAQDEPAREVLKSLISLEGQANATSMPRHPPVDHWDVNCDGTGARWCFIEVRPNARYLCPIP